MKIYIIILCLNRVLNKFYGECEVFYEEKTLWLMLQQIWDSLRTIWNSVNHMSCAYTDIVILSIECILKTWELTKNVLKRMLGRFEYWAGIFAISIRCLLTIANGILLICSASVDNDHLNEPFSCFPNAFFDIAKRCSTLVQCCWVAFVSRRCWRDACGWRGSKHALPCRF